MTLFSSRIFVLGLLGCGVLPAFAQDSIQSGARNVAQNSTHGGLGSPAAVSSSFPARLSDVEGSVRIAQPRHGDAALPRQGSVPPPPPADQEGQTIHAGSVNTPVLAGTQISTGGDGRAEIEFNDGNIARIAPNSSVEVVALPTGGEEVRALRGLSYFETVDTGVGAMTVQVGPDSLRPDSGTLLRVDLDNAPFQVAMLRGTAHFLSTRSDVEFSASQGQTAAIDPVAADSYDVHDELADTSWDTWNTDRDQTLAELAQSQTNARIGNGDVDSPGWNDLDYYGTWYNVPGAGMAWAPDGVDQNFDPYGSGSWGYYSGVGYTWVSAYPWGWLPYHSGAWNYFPGFGWGWQPGGGVYGGAGWYPYTGVHQGPPNYRLPLPFDGRLRTRLTGAPLPPPTALRVNRAPAYGFRGIGGARPEPRPFPLGNAASTGSAPAFAPTVPVIQPGRVQYQPGGAGFAGRTGYGAGVGPGYNGGAQGQRIYQGQLGQPGPRIATPGPSTITPTPRVLPAPRVAITPPPHVVVPSPARIAPPPVVAVPGAARPH